MDPVIEQLQAKGFPVSKIDVVQQANWADAFKVSRTPTYVIVSGNQRLGTSEGILTVAQLENAMRKAEGMIAGNSGQSSSTRNANSVPQSAIGSNSNLNNVAIGGSNGSSHYTSVNNNQFSQSNNKANSATARELAFRATVRLRVEDELGVSHGTGTIIHVQQGTALVLTCGHIFRDSKGNGKLSVEYGFADQRIQSAPGQLLACDWQARDVALLTVPIQQSIQPVTLANASLRMQRGENVFSIGCSKGNDPTINECQVKRTAKYGLGENTQNMALKIDTTVKPVDGRSGGGLFNNRGELVGVCNAAAVDIDEGIYSAMENVSWQLGNAKLAHLFQNGSRLANSENRLANVGSPISRTTPNTLKIQLQNESGQPIVYTIQNPSAGLLDQVRDEAARTARLGNPSTNDNSPRVATRPDEMPRLNRSVIDDRRDRFRAQSPR